MSPRTQVMTETRDLHTQNVNIRDAQLRLTALDVSYQLPRQVTHSGKQCYHTL